MKLFLFAAMAAVMFGQDAKIAVAPAGPPAPATERPLSENEILKLKLAQSQIQVLRDKYKIDEYQKEVGPISQSQMSVAQDACLSVGVAKDKLQTECGLQTGFDGDGKPLTGPDGKSAEPKVWKIAPPPAEVKK